MTPPPAPHALQTLAGIVAAGVGAHWLAARLRLPAILVLLLAGLLLGPVLGLVQPDALLGDLLRPLVSLAVAVILFEGGLSLRIAEARRLGRPLLGLVGGGLVVTFVLATLAARHLAGLDTATSAVLGAILVVTGPTVVRPMLRQAGLSRRPAALLKWEGIVNDPLGALLAVLVLEVVAGDGGAGRTVAAALPLLLGAGAAGVVCGLLLARGMDRGIVPEHLKAPAALAVGLGLYAAAEAAHHEAGLLAVTLLGVAMANSRSASVEDVRRFKEDATTLLVSLLFVVLAARLDLDDLRALTGPALLFVAAVIFVVRPLAVGLGTLGSGLPWRERLLIGWVAPRGVVAAAVGAALAPALQDAGHEDARLLVPILFGVILATVVVHGFTVGPLARRLGIASRGGGLLIVGAASWALDLASALRRAGVEVLVADVHRRNVARARQLGLPAVRGSVLAEEVLDELPLEQTGWLLAATDDDQYNARVCMALARLFGRETALQIAAAAGEEGEEAHLHGRSPWGPAVTFASLAARWWGGARFKATRLTEEFGWEAFRGHNGGALVLFAVVEGKLQPVEPDSEPPEGCHVVWLPAGAGRP